MLTQTVGRSKPDVRGRGGVRSGVYCNGIGVRPSLPLLFDHVFYRALTQPQFLRATDDEMGERKSL